MKLAEALPFDFFFRYPIKYYLTGTLPRPAGHYAGIFLSEERVALLAKTTNKPGLVSFYNHSVEGYEGAPKLDSGDDDGELKKARGSNPFRQEVLARSRLDRDGKFTVVIDSSKGYFNLHSVDPKQFVNNAEFRRLLTTSPVEIIPSWTSIEPHEWEILNQELAPVADDQVNDQVFVVGLPQSTVKGCIDWVMDQNGLLNGIIPAPAAVAGWFIQKFHPGETPAFLLYSRGTQTVLFFFLSNRCVHIKRMRENAENLSNSIGDITKEMQDLLEERGIAYESVPLYVWESESEGEVSLTEMIGHKIWSNCVGLTRSLISEKDKIAYAGDLQTDAFVLDWAVAATS